VRRFRTNLDVEVRAAEIVASIHHEYKRGGWFADMTDGEHIGWIMYSDAQWLPDAPDATPRNRRQAAGWLAAAMHDHDVYLRIIETPEGCTTCGSSFAVCEASRDQPGTTQYQCHHTQSRGV
jgi:hypothetical protein